MSIIVPPLTTKSIYAQSTGRSSASVRAATYLVKMRFLAPVTTSVDEVYASTADSFGFQVYPLSTNTIRISMRTATTTRNRDVSVPTLTIGDEYTFAVTFDFDGSGEMRFYSNGVQLGATDTCSGENHLPTTVKFQLAGSTRFRNRIQFLEAAVCDETTLTPTDIANYHSGTALNALSVDVHHIYALTGTAGNHPSSLADTGTLANDALSRVQGPSSGGHEVVYVDDVDVFTSNDDDKFYLQRTSEVLSSNTLTGTYGTTTPTGMDYRLLAENGSVVSGFDWAPLANFTTVSNVWSGGIVDVPVGAEYVIQFRFANDNTRMLYATPKKVGAIINWGGQSNPERTFSAILTNPVTPISDAYIASAGTYDAGATTLQLDYVQNANAGQAMANELRTRLGVPVLLVMCAIGATGINEMIPGAAKYDDYILPIMETVGDFEATFFSQGESDVGGDLALYQTRADTYISSMLSINGRTLGTNYNFLWTMLGRNTNSPSTGPWGQFRAMQASFPTTRNGVYLAGHAIDADMADFLHYSNDWYVTWAKRIAKSYAKVKGIVANYGIGATVGPLAASGNTITIPVFLNGGTDLIKDTVAAATGFNVYSSDSFATELTITDVQYVAPNIEITTVEAVNDDVVVRHAYDDNPDISNMFKTTGNDIDDIGLYQFTAVWAPAQNLGWKTTADSELYDSSGVLLASTTLDRVVFKGSWDDSVGPILAINNLAVDASGLVEYPTQALGAESSIFDVLAVKGDNYWLLENQTVIDLDA